ncbi:MAG: hypothetical protein M5U09_04625, partial [Gammaproteobacteria bacterium]|nr:hypothetical protein [Gammaproteobacteria bacterium]
MGGTSFDIGLIAGGGIRFYEFSPVIDRWRVDIPMVFLSAVGAGGGSIARYDSTIRSITVGPESAGSEPGPACFDMGGTEATVTDADLVLGYLNADYYNEGRTASRRVAPSGRSARWARHWAWTCARPRSRSDRSSTTTWPRRSSRRSRSRASTRASS